MTKCEGGFCLTCKHCTKEHIDGELVVVHDSEICDTCLTNACAYDGFSEPDQFNAARCKNCHYEEDK